MTIPAGIVALVDDDVFVLRALERALTAYQFRVKTYTSAEQYLEQADAREILCAVVDIHLGDGLSGFDLAERISRSTPATPVVFITASDSPVVRERARKVGCVAYLHKPFLTSMLIGTIMTIEGQESAQ